METEDKGNPEIGERAPRTELPPAYDPKQVEDRWYKFWEENGFFRGHRRPGEKPFTIVIPPPNITGSLHMGHALDNTIQDVLIRHKRMQGRPTLWLPGTDHASIATHMKIEEMLEREDTNRYELGREQFMERAWEWKRKYAGTITNQLRKMGSSCDWSRERFTMDEGCSRAVREVFVRLYEKGLIYRGERITNWCPGCQTVVSDIEVEHEDLAGSLWYVKYPLLPEKAGGPFPDGYITVATSRPETILGDTGVAVNPKDARYRGLVGRKVKLPVLGREIPIVKDDYVDPEFGTGAVKVTPAHDPNDFEMGGRHGLAGIKVIGLDGKMTAEAGPFAGQDRYECRKNLLQWLDGMGLLVKEEKIQHAVGQCYRCHTVVEPMVSRQWFVSMKSLAEPAIQAVKDGRIRFVPERFTKVYLNWMENIQDWCISRQLWWGHRIPAWYCQECGETIVAKEDPEQCPKCGAGAEKLQQESDILDTWFSSALWPFSTLGWPDRTEDLAYWYPTSVLVTGYDIIFFWVARMIFSGLEHMGEVPFRDVLIHGLIRDSQGRKMSKSLGNGIDPLEVIDKYGADTLRFMLVTGNTPGNDMRFYWERVEGSRNFCNKIWNAARFVLMNLEQGDGAPASAARAAHAAPVEPAAGDLELPERWILGRLDQVTRDVGRYLDEYELGEASRTLYDFIWGDYCDWYIELAKPKLSAGGRVADTARWTLWHVLETTMRLLHPFMPFLTEEIWQHLPHEGRTIMLASWPVAEEGEDYAQAVADMGLIMETVKTVRNLRAELALPPAKKVRVVAHVDSERTDRLLRDGEMYVRRLAGLDDFDLQNAGGARPKQALAGVVPGGTVYLPLSGLVDIDRELARLNKELAAAADEIRKAEARLDNPSFRQKAPAEVVEKELARKREFEDKAARLKERLTAIQDS